MIFNRSHLGINVKEKRKFTVWFAITFMEALFAELLAALCAEEVLCMPGFIQSGYTFIKNGTVAISTTWAKQIVVIWFTYLYDDDIKIDEKQNQYKFHLMIHPRQKITGGGWH